MAKHSTPRRRSGKHWVGTLLTAGAVVACMGLLLRFLPVGTIPTGGDEPSDSAVSSTEPAASSVPEPEPEPVVETLRFSATGDDLIHSPIYKQAARRAGGSAQVAPAQRLTDFVADRRSADLPATSYVPGTVPSRFSEWMPEFIGGALREGFAVFGRRMHGFLTDGAQVVGVESRTSSPVRIPRDPVTLMHVSVRGLYPAAEGAGYAGGIISAALDGERIAEAIVRNLG